MLKRAARRSVTGRFAGMMCVGAVVVTAATAAKIVSMAIAPSPTAMGRSAVTTVAAEAVAIAPNLWTNVLAEYACANLPALASSVAATVAAEVVGSVTTAHAPKSILHAFRLDGWSCQAGTS